MNPASTNLHFHGLEIPPSCHQDEVIHTAVQPGGPAFEYRFKIPASQPSRALLVSPSSARLQRGAVCWAELREP